MPDSAAKKAWKAKNTTRIVMSLNNNTDVDILEKLSKATNKQGYIKSLIRADIRTASASTKGMTHLQKKALDLFSTKEE